MSPSSAPPPPPEGGEEGGGGGAFHLPNRTFQFSATVDFCYTSNAFWPILRGPKKLEQKWPNSVRGVAKTEKSHFQKGCKRDS